MSRAAVDTLLWLMDEAFQRSEHSLLVNLGAVDDAAWTALPAGGGRTIASMVVHVAQCKYMYENFAFGDCSLRFDQGIVAAPVTRPDVTDWLAEGHRRLAASVAALDDADLPVPRPLNRGGTRPARGIISTMIEHDLYHAGEINHLRSLLAGRDAWPDYGASG